MEKYKNESTIPEGQKSYSKEPCQDPASSEMSLKESIQNLSQKNQPTVHSVSMEMPKYKCIKEVWALKIKNIIHDGEGEDRETDGSAIITPIDDRYAPFPVDAEYMHKHKPVIGGYFVVYKDGYKSFSPADVFEEGYIQINEPLSNIPSYPIPFSFGSAIERLKQGRKVARKGWNGKGMYLKMQVQRTLGIPLDGNDTGNMLPFIAMKVVGDSKQWGGGSIDLVPWLASQTDILANDWVIVE